MSKPAPQPAPPPAARPTPPAPKTGQWFHPRTLLDKTYEIGILIKGVDGVLELLGALLLVAVPTTTIRSLTHWLTANELANDPHDFLASHVAHFGNELAKGHNTFAILFLATHGAVKVALVVALLRQKHWAYPWALGALGAFLVYQVYLLVVKPTFGMGFLTVLDVVIIWLVWREWQKVKGGALGAGAPDAG
ncbi:MAG TPA: DUF2127 domain-containing protein [Candidatus Saccharimonadales bacterium]|nr:DUF2127 domain-containing protein [Candidatus Saccharimonadales bacterium]